jgi:hypothetical protein
MVEILNAELQKVAEAALPATGLSIPGLKIIDRVLDVMCIFIQTFKTTSDLLETQ